MILCRMNSCYQYQTQCNLTETQMSHNSIFFFFLVQSLQFDTIECTFPCNSLYISVSNPDWVRAICWRSKANNENGLLFFDRLYKYSRHEPGKLFFMLSGSVQLITIQQVASSDCTLKCQAACDVIRMYSYNSSNFSSTLSYSGSLEHERVS